MKIDTAMIEKCKSAVTEYFEDCECNEAEDIVRRVLLASGLLEPHTCETCKSWEDVRAEELGSDCYEGRCNLERPSDDVDPSNTLYSDHDFGCNQWEAK